MNALRVFNPVTNPDGSEAISVLSNNVTTLAMFFAGYWESQIIQPVPERQEPQLQFDFAGHVWQTNTVIPITTRGFILAAYEYTSEGTGICFALERVSGPWRLVKHFTWLHGGPGELDGLTASEACRLFRELETGRRMP